MNDDVRALREILNRYDPRSGAAATDEQRSRARVTALSLAQAAPIRPARERRPLVAAAATAAAAVALGVFSSVSGDSEQHVIPAAYADAPPPLEITEDELADGRDTLLGLAEKAEAQSPAAALGDVAYVRTSGMELWMVESVDTGERSSGFIPVDTESWASLDGELRVVEQPGPPQHWTGDHSERQDLLVRSATDHREQVHPKLPPEPLPTDPAALEEWLLEFALEDERASYDGGFAPLMHAISAVYGSRPVEPAVQGAILRILAERDDVSYAGESADREDRPGLLFEAADGAGNGSTRYRLLFDADTGRLLYRETTVTGDADGGPDYASYGLETPLTLQYTHYLESGWVEDLESRP